jgi:carbamoyl-phosphate synthase small subunit
MSTEIGYLVLETGEVYQGRWRGGADRAGEVVFNTSHTGYEEMATDPSYFSQILVLTAPMQGNYGVDKAFWESRNIWISGFVSLQLQSSQRDDHWAQRLREHGVPILTDFDTRKLVLRLREEGTPWGALVRADSEEGAISKAKCLIAEAKKGDKDWVFQVSREEMVELEGFRESGPRVAVLDFGCKENILRELQSRCSRVAVFPCRTSSDEIKQWDPNGVLLSNGPGNPEDVRQAVDTVKELLGWRSLFGICMGHQILSRALGGRTFKLVFGHRGSNHPIKDELLQMVYVTSQNHGYAVEKDSLPTDVEVTHTNLNDFTVAGIRSIEKKCMSVQFHPESHPGPHDAETLFDLFVKQMQ